MKINPKDDFVFNTFKQMIEEKGLKIDLIDNEGLIHVKIKETELKISLDNVRRKYQTDKDIVHITDLIEIINYELVPIPEWSIAKHNILLSLFPSDFDFQDIPYEKVTNDFNKICVYYSAPRITWINNKHLRDWNINIKTLTEQAEKNMKIIVDQLNIIEELFDGRLLLYLETPYESFKSAILFSNAFKNMILDKYGAPMYYVLPVRDFCYFFSETDKDYFLERLGNTVKKEFEESGNPITKEVIRITRNEIIAIGKYE
jgi:hypothetical protein